MKALKLILAICCVAAIGVGVSSLSADTWNKKTTITINAPLQIPGAVLTPGTYVFKLWESSSNRHVVRVFNENETQVIRTILAIPNERLKPTGKSEFAFWEVPAGSTAALRAWFYPGDNFGQEFRYPKQEATQLAQVVKQEVPSVPEEEYAKAVAPPAPKPVPLRATPAPQPAPEPERQVAQAAPTPAPAPVEEPKAKLPTSASPLPLIGLLGLLFAGLGVALRARRG
jgi:hypothetical protein